MRRLLMLGHLAAINMALESSGPVRVKHYHPLPDPIIPPDASPDEVERIGQLGKALAAAEEERQQAQERAEVRRQRRMRQEEEARAWREEESRKRQLLARQRRERRQLGLKGRRQ